MHRKPRKRQLRYATSAFALLLIFFSGGAAADLQDERRLTVGLRLFPALVAANQDLNARLDAQGKVEILLLYREDPRRAARLAARLATLENIGGHGFHVDTAPLSRLSEFRDSPPAGIFLTEWLPGALERIVQFGIETQTVVFSPFRSDVRNGVLGGLHVSDRILPYINMRTLQASKLRIKPFFLEVAKRYE